MTLAVPSRKALIVAASLATSFDRTDEMAARRKRTHSEGQLTRPARPIEIQLLGPCLCLSRLSLTKNELLHADNLKHNLERADRGRLDHLSGQLAGWQTKPRRRRQAERNADIINSKRQDND